MSSLGSKAEIFKNMSFPTVSKEAISLKRKTNKKLVFAL